VVSFTPRKLYPRERAPVTHWIGGWMNPRAGLVDVEKRKLRTTEKGYAEFYCETKGHMKFHSETKGYVKFHDETKQLFDWERLRNACLIYQFYS
jgi:hypothetical protein